MRILYVMLLATFFISSGTLLRADIPEFYLNGAVGFIAGPAGNNTNEPAEFDTFDTLQPKFFINGSTRTTTRLVSGENTFTITNLPATFNAIELFFTRSSTLLDASTNFGLEGNLVVFVTNPPLPIAPFAAAAAAADPGFAVPIAGVPVATLGVNSGNAPYSGAQFFDIDGQRISITDWNGSTLSLSVVAVPEPSSLAIIAAGATSVAYRRMKRRKNNQTAI